MPAICMLVLTTAMHGTDVYFYHHSTENPVNRMTNAHKLVFNETSTEVADAKGGKTLVNHDDFDYILFRAKSEPSAIATTSASQQLAITVSDDEICITSAEAIEKVTLTDIAGRTLAAYTPATTAVELATRDLPAGLVIITAISGNQTNTIKTFLK